MSNIIGFNVLIIITISILFLIRKNSKLTIIIFIALLIRVIFANINFFIIDIEGSASDAIRFEAVAYIIFDNTFITNNEAINCQCILDYNNNNFIVPKNLQNYSLLNFHFSSSYFISYFISFIYYLFGRIPLLIIHLSVISGVLSILLIHIILKNILKNDYSYFPIILLSLFPTHILYSSLILRESFAILFLLISLLLFLKWFNSLKIIFFIFSILSLFFAILFHESYFGVLVLYLLLSLFKFSKQFFLIKNSILQIFFLILIILIIYFIYYNTFQNVIFGKIQNLSYLFSIDYLSQQYLNRSIGYAKFPEFLYNENPLVFILLTPIKIIYFLFSPFIWDIKNLKQSIGVIDSVFYIFLTLFLFKNFKSYYKYPEGKIILLLMIPMLIYFSITTANYGTAIRHRLKILPFILILFSFKKNK
tara:strand:- start:6845 stop:8107 length:1263 start_codon:yes stop_codon:yes gene_type:complete